MMRNEYMAVWRIMLRKIIAIRLRGVSMMRITSSSVIGGRLFISLNWLHAGLNLFKFMVFDIIDLP